ncbi:MAG: multicopper oxidase domain-containing protein [Steroidobacteraceae bacterium]
MSNTLRKHSIRAAGYKAVLAAFLLTGGTASAAPVAVTLCAKAGTSVSPAVPVWGYVKGDCASATAPTAPGGPVIDVNVGDVVTITLDNSLTEATGLAFQGQGLPTDKTGAAPAGTRPYTFTATKAGTYLYEAAPLANAQHQVAMGLYGALVVRSTTTMDAPVRTGVSATTMTGSQTVAALDSLASDNGLVIVGAGIPDGTRITAVEPGVYFTIDQAATAGDGTTPVTVDLISRRSTAYGTPSVYDDEAIVVLSEIDADLNTSADPATFDMRNFGSNALGRPSVPMYYLINGKSYPATLPIDSTAGHTLLVRYVNAGARHHSMGLLGLRQRFIAKDGNQLPTADVALTAETLAPGQTGDVLVTIPSLTTASQFALYDASLHLQNRDDVNSKFGGMLTFVKAGTGSGMPGPTTSGVTVSPNPAKGDVPVALAASVTSTDADGVTKVEYFIDSKGVDGAGTQMDPGVAAPSYGATISTASLALLAPGNHTFYVHGQDAKGWGGYSFAVLNLDKVGPTSSALTMNPNPSKSGATVVLRATASDAASGGSKVTGAKYCLGTALFCGNPDNWLPMTLGGVPAQDVSVSASFAAPATTTTVYVHGVDELGNVGADATATLTVSAGGPTTVINALSPNPTNGVQGYNSSTPAVRVIATMNSSAGTIAGGEAFVSACASGCAAGSGIPMIAGDGSFNAAAETGYADIPLTTIAGLANGNYAISVHGRDSAGTWGAFATGTLTVNRGAPTVTNVRLTPPYTKAPAAGALPVLVTANVTDATTGNNPIADGEYFIDTVGAPGTGTSMARATASATTTVVATIPVATLGALSEGTHTVFVQARDSGGNWSAVLGAALIVDRTAPYLVSFTANGPLLTNANSVSYTVTFSESIATANGGGLSGLSGQDFQVLRNGSTNQTNGIQVAVSGTGATRTVRVSGYNGSTNSILLRLRSPGTGSTDATITDLAGNNWVNSRNVSLDGATYTIDRTAPAFSMSLTPSSVPLGTASVTMNITGASDASGIASAVWWIGGSTPPPGGGTAFTLNGGTASVVIDTSSLAAGTYTVRALLTDAVGNTAARQATLRVLLPAPTVTAAFTGSVSRTANAAGRTTTYVITFTNPNAVAIAGLGLSDALPQPAGTGSSLSIPSNPVSTCGGTVGRSNQSRTFTVNNNNAIPANGSCSVTVAVVLSLNAGNAAGYSLTDTINVGDVTSSNAASNTSPASASLTVLP